MTYFANQHGIISQHDLVYKNIRWENVLETNRGANILKWTDEKLKYMCDDLDVVINVLNGP